MINYVLLILASITLLQTVNYHNSKRNYHVLRPAAAGQLAPICRGGAQTIDTVYRLILLIGTLSPEELHPLPNVCECVDISHRRTRNASLIASATGWANKFFWIDWKIQFRIAEKCFEQSARKPDTFRSFEVVFVSADSLSCNEAGASAYVLLGTGSSPRSNFAQFKTI